MSEKTTLTLVLGGAGQTGKRVAADTIRLFAKTSAASRVRRLALLSGRGGAEALLGGQGVRDAGADTRRWGRPMIDGYSQALTLVAALGAGLAAGVFFAFSTFVMSALGRLPATQGIAAMQAINKEAPTPWFMTALFGTAVVCVALLVSALRRLDEPAAVYQVIGSVLYLAGIVLTIVYHVPRNDALALLDPTSSGAAAAWTHYRAGWTAWNHVRTLTSLAGALTFTLALRLGL